MSWKGGFNQGFTRDEFAAYVQTLHWTGWRPQFITLHNTGSPSLAQWKATPGGEKQRIKNLEHYYRDQQGWSSGPHLFIGVEKIWLGTPLTVSGTHTPSWNSRAIGIEVAGDYDRDPFVDPVKTNVIHALAVLHGALGLSPEPYKLGVRGLHFHKEDRATTHKHCPGKNIVKPDLVLSVKAAMLALHSGEHQSVVESTAQLHK